MAKVVSTNKPNIVQFIYVYVQRSDFSCVFMMITKTITPSVKFLYVMPEIVGKKISMGRRTGCLPSDHQLRQNPSLVSRMPMIKTTHILVQMLEEKE